MLKTLGIGMPALILLFSSSGFGNQNRITHGEAVGENEHREVVQVHIASAVCSGTVVGPRTVLTAAHCGENNIHARVTIGNNTTVPGVFYRHPSFPEADIDLGIVITDELLPKVTSAKIGGEIEIGKNAFILGYGCTETSGLGGNDGLIRKAEVMISDEKEFEIVTSSPHQATVCYGDSGGPVYSSEEEGNFLLAIHSKLSIEPKASYHARLDTPEAKDFFNEIIDTHAVVICGINSACKNK